MQKNPEVACAVLMRDPDVVDAIAKINRDRRKSRQAAWGIFGILQLLTIPVAFYIAGNDTVFLIFCLIAGTIWAAVAAVLAYASWFEPDLDVAFKLGVVRRIVRVIDPRLKYEPASGLPLRVFEGLGLYDAPDRYSGEDLISGVYHDVPLSFSEVHAEREISDGNKQKRYSTIFKGVCMNFAFNKHFAGSTLVVPDVAEGVFGQVVGNFMQKCNLSHREKLTRMEDPEFEKTFAVYTSDPVEARYLLSPKMMRQMTALCGILRTVPVFVFRQGTLSVAVPSCRNYFERPEGEVTPDAVMLKFREIMQFLALVDLFELDVHLWSKE